MSCHTPDSWIESEANGAPCDDAGYCDICEEHLDSGRCPGHCENETCDHLTHCDKCERGLYKATMNGLCHLCLLEWKAQHQLADRSEIGKLVDTLGPQAAGLEFVLRKLDKYFANPLERLTE